MNTTLLAYLVLLVGAIALVVLETRRYNRRNPSPAQREADRRRTAVIPATWSAAICAAVAITAIICVLRGWWLVAIIDIIALVPMTWFTLTRWRLHGRRSP